MAPQDIKTRMNLVLSSDPKPRLKWTPELHHRFACAVDQLGGAEKATPKSLMRVMGIHGLTLYHLKSHLQKYRLGRSKQSRSCNQNKLQENRRNCTVKSCSEAPEHDNESLEAARALPVQMEVQKKLHEQIEVQRHLQLRIEAQGKYLQSVLKKAHDTLSGYISCTIEVENARDQLAQLASTVDSVCPSSSLSAMMESDGSILKDARSKLLGHNSIESSLTSSESSGRDMESQPDHEVHTTFSEGKQNPVENREVENQVNNRKRSKSTTDGVNHVEQCSSDKSRAENSDEQVQRLRALGSIDLNCNSMDDTDSDQDQKI